MKYDEETDICKLKSGREVVLRLLSPRWPSNYYFTLKERKEIAEYMINLWKEWAGANEMQFL